MFQLAELTEEEIILEQSFEIPTIPVKNSGGGEEECPICMEQFNQVYKQVGNICLFLAAVFWIQIH